MAFYIVERTDDYRYDEYDSVIVRATGPKKALAVVTAQGKYGPEYAGFKADGSNAIVRKLPDVVRGGPAEAVLASFIAG